MFWSFSVFMYSRFGGVCAPEIWLSPHDCFRHVALYCAAFSAFLAIFRYILFETVDAKGCAVQ